MDNILNLPSEKRKIVEFFTCDDPILVGNLEEALYTISEKGLWPDYVDTVSTNQALVIWKIVEKLRVSKFPEELKL